MTNWLREHWPNVLLAVSFVGFGWMVTVKLNTWARSTNAYMRQTDARLDALELQAAMWQATENDRLVSRDER